MQVACYLDVDEMRLALYCAETSHLTCFCRENAPNPDIAMVQAKALRRLRGGANSMTTATQRVKRMG